MDETLQHEIFDRYLRGEMQEKELLEFEKQMASSEPLRKDFRLYELIAGGIRDVGKEDFISNLQLYESDLPKEPAIIGIPGRWYAYAAGILILISLGLYSMFLNKDLDYSRYYQAHYTKYTNDLVYYSRGGEIPELFSGMAEPAYNALVKAFRAYDKGDFKQLISFSDENPAILNTFPEINFFYAICLMEEGRFGDAVDPLAKLADDTSGKYSEAAKWYLSLSYLKLKKTQKAIQLLKEISPENEFSGDASNLLKEINSKAN